MKRHAAEQGRRGVGVRLGLLDVAANRATAEAAVVVLPTLLAWYGHSLSGRPDLVPWAIGMALLAPLLHLARRRYRRERQVSDVAAMVQRWEPRLIWSAVFVGMAWSLPPLLSLHTDSLVFSLIFYMVLQGVSIGSSGYLGAVFPAFAAFMAGIWVPALLAVPRFFPDQWGFLLPMFVLFVAVVSRHAWGMYRFMQRQLMAEELERDRAQRYKGDKEAAESALYDRSLFLATASHDLRQPVHAMTLLVEALMRRNRDPALDPMLEDLGHSMASMNLMFGSLLDLSRLDVGRVQQSPTEIGLTGLLSEVVSVFREQASRRGLQLRWRRPPPQARVYADPLLMRQALVNLVHNALRYTEAGGLLLGVRRRGASWRIEVWDTGMGITTEDRERIFSPFYRNQRAGQIDSAGHGLGLAVVARCVRMMNAELGFDSRLGAGSRFWLQLPALVEDPRRPVSAAAPPSRPQHAMLSGRCLVVDDDPQAVAAWCSLLESWGVNTRGTSSGTEALAAVDAGFVPQAVLCDQQLRAGESGFDVLRALLARCPGASGALISGQFDSPELREADAEGYIVLHKPVNPADLHALLLTWFDHRMSPSV